MYRLLVAAMLLAACRGDQATNRRDDADHHGSASVVSVVPKLPRTEDGVAELRALDKRIELAAAKPTLISLLLDRASVRGQLDDYVRAVHESAALVDASPDDVAALQLRLQVLLRVHEFAAARSVLAKLGTLVNPSNLADSELTLADATGDSERALAGRERNAKEFPSADRLTLWAAALAQAGRFDEAVALVPKAAAAIHSNPPQLIAWLLFQWGRVYELKGELANARQLFAESHARVPGYLEATTHLAQTMIATGDREGARKLVDEALADNRHPELLALAAELGHPERGEQARAEWERYVAALPLAFSDHAARFYLGVGHDPARALELARVNFKNRDTRDARALVIEAALAAGDPASACAVVDPLRRGGTRAQRFAAWQALSRCGRATDADPLARELGIAH